MFTPPTSCTPSGVVETRRKFQAQMTLFDSSERVKVYTQEELIGIELMSRDDEIIRTKKERK